MKISALLSIFALALSVQTATAQVLLDVYGEIGSSNSSYVNVGDQVTYRQKIAFPFVEPFAPYLPAGYKIYDTVGLTSILIGAKTFNGNGSYAQVSYDAFGSGSYGLFSFVSGLWPNGLTLVDLELHSTNSAYVGVDGLPLPFLPVAFFETAGSRFEFVDGTVAEWKITGYSIVRPGASAVPEPATYGLFAGVGLIGITLLQRRKRAASKAV